MSSAPGMTERAFGNGLRIEAAIARYRPNPEIDSGG